MPNWTVYLEGGPRRVNHAACAIGKTIFSFGGYCSGEAHDSKDFIDVHALNTNTYRWYPVSHSNITSTSKTSELREVTRRAMLDDVTKSEVPYQRYGHTVVAHNDKAYVWGGRNDDFGASNNIHEFNPVTREWRKLQVDGFVPAARDGHTAVVADGKMVVFGGFEEELQRFSQETFVFDFETCKWHELRTEGVPPLWRDFHTAAIIGQKMYIFGGRSDQSGQFHSTNDVYDDNLMELNLKTCVWSKVVAAGSTPGGRRSHSAWVYNNKMYMFGGFLGSQSVHYNELYCFDPETAAWTIVKVAGNYPIARRRHCTVTLNNRVFLFGGTAPNSSRCRSSDSISTGLVDLSDLHVLDYTPSLKQLALIEILNKNLPSTKMYECMHEYLPLNLREELYWMTTPNNLSAQMYQRNENSG